MVVAFHCLEHVEEPMQLAKEMLDITDEKGMCNCKLSVYSI